MNITRKIVEWNDEQQDDDYDYHDPAFEEEPGHEADSLKEIWPKDAVQNPNFVHWFQGSKVVDEAGLPLMVHRGRSQRWTIMPTGHAAALRASLEKGGMDKSFGPEIDFAERLGDVAWFTDDESIASGYHDGAKEGDVLTAYLNLKNPLILSVEMLGEEEAERRISEILQAPQSLRPQWGTPKKAMADKIVYDNSLIVQWAKAHGHDGLIHDDTCILGRYTHTSYVAFAPEQIKSSLNTGEFSPSDLNIHR